MKYKVQVMALSLTASIVIAISVVHYGLDVALLLVIEFLLGVSMALAVANGMLHKG
jgi:hypothetical protein